MGTAVDFNIDDNSSNEYPLNTLLSCGSWYAGAGDYLCVCRKNDKYLSIQWKEQDEGWEEGEEPETSNYKEIIEVEIPENAIIEVFHRE